MIDINALEPIDVSNSRGGKGKTGVSTRLVYDLRVTRKTDKHGTVSTKFTVGDIFKKAGLDAKGLKPFFQNDTTGKTVALAIGVVSEDDALYLKKIKVGGSKKSKTFTSSSLEEKMISAGMIEATGDLDKYYTMKEESTMLAVRGISVDSLYSLQEKSKERASSTDASDDTIEAPVANTARPVTPPVAPEPTAAEIADVEAPEPDVEEGW